MISKEKAKALLAKLEESINNLQDEYCDDAQNALYNSQVNQNVIYTIQKLFDDLIYDTSNIIEGAIKEVEEA